MGSMMTKATHNALMDIQRRARERAEEECQALRIKETNTHNELVALKARLREAFGDKDPCDFVEKMQREIDDMRFRDETCELADTLITMGLCVDAWIAAFDAQKTYRIAAVNRESFTELTRLAAEKAEKAAREIENPMNLDTECTS